MPKDRKYTQLPSFWNVLNIWVSYVPKYPKVCHIRQFSACLADPGLRGGLGASTALGGGPRLAPAHLAIWAAGNRGAMYVWFGLSIGWRVLKNDPAPHEDQKTMIATITRLKWQDLKWGAPGDPPFEAIDNDAWLMT